MRFLVVDGNSVLSRDFYGIKMLSNKSGQMTNGIYGFLSTFKKLLSEVSPDRIAIAFDLPAPTFRHQLYQGYKSNRKGMPEELFSQLEILKKLLVAMGYKLVSLPGYEADDILGTFASYCEKNNYECVLATGDRDILQLISDNVSVRMTLTKFGKSESILYGEEKVKEEYGTNPINLVDVKALQGDTSDNIPGVKGIGQKTARELISKYQTIDYIYNNLSQLDIKPGVKEKLLSGKGDAYISYKLGKIIKDVPIEINEKDYEPSAPDIAEVRRMFKELEFFSLLDKLENPNDEPLLKVSFKRAKSIEWIKSEILKEKKIVFLADIQDLAVKSILIQISGNVYALEEHQSELLEYLAQVEDVEKVTYNLKILEHITQKRGIEMKGELFDVMLASYLIMPSEKDYSIEQISKLFNLDLPSINCEDNSLLELCERAREVFLVSSLEPILKEKIFENNQNYLLEKVEQPLSEVLASMENIGFVVDKHQLEEYSEELEQELCVMEKCIYDAAGEEFNINSPKQLGIILFEKLGLPKGRRGKTGYSTNAQTLEKLRGSHEIVDGILGYRMLSKLKSTYCDGMIKSIGKDGKIHSSFNQTETRTGRISSTEPNLQNIPVRTERGKIFRKFFKASEGNILIDADYSQIELRVLAHVSQDKNMINAFNNQEDIHTLTASEIMKVSLEDVTAEMRSKAKTINFGILYGMSAYSLSQDLKISCADAQDYIDRYLEHYKGVNDYMNNVIKIAATEGFVETMFHRRRYLPELQSSNYNLRGFGERVARNMPIQGTAADIIKTAMINVFEKLKNKNSKLILQVHDELIVEAPESEADEVKEILKVEMETAVPLLVPLEVNVSVGKTWFDAKS